MLALDGLRAGDEPELPEQVATLAEAVAGAAAEERLELARVERQPSRQVADALELAARLALGDDRLGVVLPHRLDVLQPHPHRALFPRAEHLAEIDVRRADLHPSALGVADERGRRIEAHRLRVQERAEELGRVVVPQPRRLVGEEAERGRVRLGEAEAGEGRELVVDLVGRLAVDAVPRGALDEPLPERLDRLLAPLPAHRAPQSLRLADREAGERHRHVEHLVLEDDDAVRVAERLAQQLVVDGRHVVRVDPQPLARVDVRVHGLALDRPRAHERDLHGQVVEVLRLRPQQALHLRAALDLEVADRVRPLDVREDISVGERDPGEVDRLAVDLGDLLDAVLDRREHPEPEQVDLEEAGVGAGVLVPLADLPAGHRRRLHRHQLDERPAGDHHPARVLRDVARQPCDLARQLGEGAPARREQPPLGLGEQGELLGHPGRVPAVGDAREPFQLGERQPERLADVTDRAARPVGREAGDERGVLAPVALGDAEDQLLADVAREVEVDVRHRHQLAVEEAAEREVLRDRVDVREAGQVADDRPDRRAPAAAGRQPAPRRSRPPDPVRELPRQLEHLPVQEEEAREAELFDQPQLSLQPRPCPAK